MAEAAGGQCTRFLGLGDGRDGAWAYTSGVQPLAFGHGANNAAVVELDCLTADLDDVTRALLAARYTKVYIVPFWEACTVTRVAKSKC